MCYTSKQLSIFDTCRLLPTIGSPFRFSAQAVSPAQRLSVCPRPKTRPWRCKKQSSKPEREISALSAPVRVYGKLAWQTDLRRCHSLALTSIRTRGLRIRVEHRPAILAECAVVRQQLLTIRALHCAHPPLRSLSRTDCKTRCRHGACCRTVCKTEWAAQRQEAQSLPVPVRAPRPPAFPSASRQALHHGSARRRFS